MTTPRQSVSKYMNPTEDIFTALDNMFLLYQLTHQQSVKLYHEKKSIHKGFSGFLHEYGMLKEITEITEMEGKPWAPLVKAIYLLENYTTHVDFKGAESLEDEELNLMVDVIKNGIKANFTLKNWLKDVEKYTPITDVIEVNFDYQFKIHKLHKIKNYKPNPKGITLYNEIYEIKNIDEMINFLRLSKQTDCLILTIMKNPKREWKSAFFMFLIYRGYLYSIDNMERRVNLDNTAGDRNPGRWMERSYEHVWLPYYLLEQKSKTEAIIVKNQIFKASTIDEVAKVDSGILIWLELFIYRVLDEIINKKVKRGVTPNNAVKLLPTANDESFVYGMSEESKGKGEYLLEKYGKEATTAMTVTKDSLPQVVGTRKYIAEIINYKRMSLIADNIKVKMLDDFNKNSMKIKKWIQKQVEKMGIEEVLIKALENHKYPITYYHQFGSGNKEKITKETIMELEETDWRMSPEDHTDIIVFNQGTKYKYDTWKGPKMSYWKRTCYFCDSPRKMIIAIKFRDYRQLIQFLDLKKWKVPKQIINHLHQQAGMYVGNTILDDVDPIDLLRDPWFTRHEPPIKMDDYLSDQDCGAKEFVIKIYTCKKCFNKYQKIADNNVGRIRKVRRKPTKRCGKCNWVGETPPGKRNCPECGEKSLKKDVV